MFFASANRYPGVKSLWRSSEGPCIAPNRCGSPTSSARVLRTAGRKVSSVRPWRQVGGLRSFRRARGMDRESRRRRDRVLPKLGSGAIPDRSSGRIAFGRGVSGRRVLRGGAIAVALGFYCVRGAAGCLISQTSATSQLRSPSPELHSSSRRPLAVASRGMGNSWTGGFRDSI